MADNPKKKKADAKTLATSQIHEIKYLANKLKVTQKAIKEAVAKIGSKSRKKVEEFILKNK